MPTELHSVHDRRCLLRFQAVLRNHRQNSVWPIADMSRGLAVRPSGVRGMAVAGMPWISKYGNARAVGEDADMTNSAAEIRFWF